MTILAATGLIGMDEIDGLAITLESPDVDEDFSVYDWLIRFSDSPLFTNLVGPTFSSVRGSIVTTPLTPGPSLMAFFLNPFKQGLGVPIDKSGKYEDHCDYYLSVLRLSRSGSSFSVDKTRGTCTLRVFRSITKP